MSDNPEDYELFHHGIKGMRWGVRRPEGPDGLVKRSVQAVKNVESKRMDNARKLNRSVASGTKKAGSKVADAGAKAANFAKTNKVYSVDNVVNRTKRTSEKVKGRSLTTQATLNKATIERQQAKEHLDETRENMKNPVNRKAAAIAGGVTGAGIGAIGGGVGGAVAGAAAGTYLALKATSDKGRQAYLKNAESKYEAAVEREKRIKDGTRSKIEKLVDWGDVTAVDLYTAKNYKVKGD